MKYQDLPYINSEEWLNLDSFDGEEWRPVVGYEMIYKISNYGRVKSCFRYVTQSNGRKRPYKERIMRCSKSKSDYIRVSLEGNGRKKKFSIHRLVAMAFIPNPNNYPCINHKDENKHNNHVDNLEWVTTRENCLHGTGTTRQKESRRHNDPEGNSWKNAAKKLAIGCCRYNKTDNSIVKTYASLTEAAHDSGINITTILNQCKGKTQSRTSTYWRYAEN